MVPENDYAQGQLYDEQALQDVVQMERLAQEIIRDAEQRGRQIVADARAKRDHMLAEAREQADRRQSARQSAEEREIAEKVASIADEVGRDTKAWLAQAQVSLDDAVTYVLRLVTLGDVE